MKYSRLTGWKRKEDRVITTLLPRNMALLCSERHCQVIVQVMLLVLLINTNCTSCTHTAEFNKTVQQGETVKEPVLKVNTLEMDDQLMTYYGNTLCAQYFCHNGKCQNDLTSVSQFQEYSGDLCFIIPNVNLSDSGEYIIVLNGVEKLLKMTLHVEAFTPDKSLRSAKPVNLMWWILVLVLAVHWLF